MDPKIKEVFETEYAKIPGFVQRFLEKNSLKDKTVKVFDFDNGYSTVRMNVSKDENAKFENRYEGITDRPDSGAYYEELPDMLDAYAAYWYAMNKKDEALIELPEIW